MAIFSTWLCTLFRPGNLIKSDSISCALTYPEPDPYAFFVHIIISPSSSASSSSILNIEHNFVYHHNNRKTFIVRAHSPFREREKLNVGTSEKYVKSRQHSAYHLFNFSWRALMALLAAWSLHYKPESYVVNRTRSTWVHSGAQLHAAIQAQLTNIFFFTFLSSSNAPR